MRYIMNDTGEVFDVTSSRQFVEEMRSTSWEQCADLKAWMASTAQRYNDSMQISIDPSTPETFVNGLVACGLAKEKEDE